MVYKIPLIFIMVLMSLNKPCLNGKSFKKLSSLKINKPSSLIEQQFLGPYDNLKCMYECVKSSLCYLIELDHANQTCSIYSFIVSADSQNAPNSDVYLLSGTDYLPFELTVGLTHYWPINNDIADYVTGQNLIVNDSVNLDRDRYDKSSSSLKLNGDFYGLPPDVYFAGDFTFTAWIYIDSFYDASANDRLIDCANGKLIDDVAISYNVDSHFPMVYFSINRTLTNTGVASVQISDGSWTHIAVTLAGTNTSVYLDGTIAGSWITSVVPRNVVRSSCYFGKSNFDYDYYSYAKFDEIKIYNRALSANEIWNQCN